MLSSLNSSNYISNSLTVINLGLNYTVIYNLINLSQFKIMNENENVTFLSRKLNRKCKSEQKQKHNNTKRFLQTGFCKVK